MRSINFLSRLMKDDSGLETTEVALGMGLLAFIGGFGFFFLGDALSEFFTGAAGGVNAAESPYDSAPIVGYTCDIGTGDCGGTVRTATP